MKAAIMQPTYLPWIGYFDLIDQVDKYVFLNNVQLVKRSWQVRNRIKTTQGQLFLTVPIRKIKSRDETNICEAIIDDSEAWREKHLKSIGLAYKKAPYFDEVFSFISGLIKTEITMLADFNINIIKNISDKIGIDVNTKFVTSSKLMGVDGKKDTLLVSICKAIGCYEYVSAKGSADYIEKDSPGGQFVKSDIKLFYHNYSHPNYDQINGNFLPQMSTIDLLFNKGFSQSLEIIRLGRRACLVF